MDVFQTDWKEKHESRGTQKPPTLLNVWQGYLGEEDESTVLERINVPTIFHPDQGRQINLYFKIVAIYLQNANPHYSHYKNDFTGCITICLYDSEYTCKMYIAYSGVSLHCT